MNKCDWSCLICGSILIAVGIGLGIGWLFIYPAVVKNNLELTPTSKTYEMWIETPLPMYLDIYLFNCTNAVEFTKDPKIKPIFEEIGPFIFREVHDRVNVTWNADGTVSYNQTRNWTFVPELSLNPDELITNLNVISLTVAHSTRNLKRIAAMAVDVFLKEFGSVFVTKPAREWLFEGMDLPMLDILNLKIISKYVKIPYDKFGFFYKRNMSSEYDGRFRMKTGSGNIDDLGSLVTWNFRNQTEFFDGNCGYVNGSSGEIFGPVGRNQQEYKMFITDVCSSLKLKFAQDHSVEGLNGKQFIGDEDMWDNGAKVPENKCYCDGECVPTGARNMSRCRQGAPIFVSYPHFYLADPSYTEGIEGMVPNKSLHEFQFTLEPTTGIPLSVRAQLQVNLLMENNSIYHLYNKLPRIFFPLMWFSQRAQITPNIADQASLLLNLNIIGIAISSILAAIGFIVIFGRAFWIHKRSSPQDDEEILVDPPSEDS